MRFDAEQRGGGRAADRHDSEGTAAAPDRPAQPVESFSMEDHAHGTALFGKYNPSVSNVDAVIMTLGIMG